MRLLYRNARVLVTVFLSAFVCACALFQPVEPLDFGGHLVSIDITGDTIVDVGDTIRLTGTGRLDGLIGLLAYDPLRDARWSSSSPGIAILTSPPATAADTLASSILVRGIRPGRVAIEASARGITGTHVVFISRVTTRPSMGVVR
jgi:hypothetical protein